MTIGQKIKLTNTLTYTVEDKMREQINSTQTHLHTREKKARILQTKIDCTHAQNVTWWWPFIGNQMAMQQEKIMAVQSN